MTNREAHEQAAGMGLEDLFFKMNGIDPEGEYAPVEPLPAPRAVDMPLALERAYIYTMIHHREMQPYEYCHAIEGELARVRLVLRKIESESCISGYDSGHVGIHRLTEEGLRIP